MSSSVSESLHTDTRLGDSQKYQVLPYYAFYSAIAGFFALIQLGISIFLCISHLNDANDVFQKFEFAGIHRIPNEIATVSSTLAAVIVACGCFDFIVTCFAMRRGLEDDITLRRQARNLRWACFARAFFRVIVVVQFVTLLLIIFWPPIAKYRIRSNVNKAEEIKVEEADKICRLWTDAQRTLGCCGSTGYPLASWNTTCEQDPLLALFDGNGTTIVCSNTTLGKGCEEELYKNLWANLNGFVYATIPVVGLFFVYVLVRLYVGFLKFMSNAGQGKYPWFARFVCPCMIYLFVVDLPQPRCSYQFVETDDEDRFRLKILKNEKLDQLSDLECGNNPECFFVKKDNGNKLACAYYHCQEDTNPRFLVIWSHGNATDLGRLFNTYYPQMLCRFLKCDVLTYDYMTYGQSSNVCVTFNDRTIESDLEAVFEHAKRRFNRKTSKILLFGESLGSYPSICLAASEAKIKGMVLTGALKSALTVIAPDKDIETPFCNDRFRSFERIDEVKALTLFVHGMADDVVPWRHSEELMKMAKNATKPLWMENLGHNCAPQCSQFWLRLVRFVFAELSGSMIRLKESPHGLISLQLTSKDGDETQCAFHLLVEYHGESISPNPETRLQVGDHEHSKRLLPMTGGHLCDCLEMTEGQVKASLPEIFATIGDDCRMTDVTFRIVF